MRAVVLALLATVVLPPAGAWWLNARRVTVTTLRIGAAAAGPRLVHQVLCGPGQVPESGSHGARDVHAQWLSLVVVDTRAIAGREADAWGHCLLVSDRWILSAGANGVIETPMDATALAGDDIGVLLK